ncbi:UDP-N-acetylglucosamine 2-epimerase [hydrothermal vent metagenome]|uniref:UDP-N-acetylglucosamine 2-epimerase n=1 Tax=hydrothermal vent metagenome TaxID=652676 RepID=A0A3B1D2A5_9ZZZZ
MKIISVVGARPNFMKIAPIVEHIKKKRSFQHILVHTGQHYDRKMSKSFFDDLGIPKPDIDLGVGSSTHANQTAQVMVKFEEILFAHQPDLVLVVGDVNSTMACSIVASKLNIPVAHVEAGLRSFDRTMPEEINRLITDSISNILFTTCRDADRNLKKEGVPAKKIFFVGNVMIDTLIKNKKKTASSTVLKTMGLKKQEYVLVTLHRPSNVDNVQSLNNLMDIFANLQKRTKIIFPVHPRTRKQLIEFGCLEKAKALPNLTFTDPLGYLDFLKLMLNCKMVLTDSGGIQEETSFLKIPCLTLRENTERPITTTLGTNYLVGMKKNKIIKIANQILDGKYKKGKAIPYWDGKAAQRIVNVLLQYAKKG